MKKSIGIPVILLFLNIFPHRACAEEALTWSDCLAEAKKNHPDLISAQEGVNQQKANKDIAASGLYPQIKASAAASTAKTTGDATDTYSYGVSGTQLVFDGFKTANDVKAASENINASQESYRFASSQVRLNLRTAFINLLKAQELIHVTEEIAGIRRDSLMLITLRYYSGLEHKGAQLTAEANLAEANFELAQANRDIELAQRRLIKEMGREEFKPLSVKGDFAVGDAVGDKLDFEKLAENNPSLLEAAAKKNAAYFNIKSAYANFAPQLSGSAGADKTGSDIPAQNDRWNLGLNVSMPIFEGGLRLAQLSRANAAYREAEADERSARDAVTVNLEQRWIGLQDAVETIDVQRKSLIAAQERCQIAEAQYSSGFIAFDNWIIIENDMVKAKKTYLDAQANAMLAEAVWLAAKGETIEYAQ